MNLSRYYWVISMNNGKTPKIRFKGFKEDWVQRKYEEIGHCLCGGDLSYSDIYENGIYDCVLYGDLYTNYDTTINNVIRKTNNKEKGLEIKKNDILFPQSTTVDGWSLISPACLNVDKAYTSGSFVIRPNNDINGNFIAYYSKGNIGQRSKLSEKAQGLTIVHLYYNSIKDVSINIPTKEEQDKISEYFMKLDHLITLHQRKVEKLEKIKKSLLKNMFL